MSYHAIAILHFELTNGVTQAVFEYGYDAGNVIGIWIMNAELIRRCVRAWSLSDRTKFVPEISPAIA